MTDASHPMLASANHDEQAEQLFVRDLRTWLGGPAETALAQLADALAPGERHNNRSEATFEALHDVPAFRGWASARRHSQEYLWETVSSSVRRQSKDLSERAADFSAIGTLEIDPDFQPPEHLARADVHLMPGGYDQDDGTLDQGAIMDRGGGVYMLGRNGGMLNDRRGHTAAAHLLHRFPGFEPRDILELGCGIGSSLVPMASYFPDAAAHGIDVGASLLRYAHARAGSLGVPLHLRLGDATAAPYADESFDLVFSCVVIHELEPGSIPAMLDECYRLLRPGGVVLHLEVPQRFDGLGLWGQIRAHIEARYNNEPNWIEATSVDYSAQLSAAGFRDIACGYQDATDHAEPGNDGFGAKSKGVFRSWTVMSGVK